MKKIDLTQEGGCRCGQVRFKVTLPPFLTMACHCTGCQRMTGSAFSLSAAFPTQGFSVIRGEPVIGGYTSEKLSWATTPAPLKFAKFPALEDYKGLMAKYTEWVETSHAT
jgi:hypothetical protein